MAVLRRHPNREPVIQACDEVAEPCRRLRRYLQSPPGKSIKCIEFLQQRFRAAGFADQAFSFGPADLALNAILVEGATKVLQRRP
jgi:hypothetical protein